MLDAAHEYKKLAEECQRVDYGDTKSVKRYNTASDRMREIVKAAEIAGPTAVQTLVTMLHDPVAGVWLAHHLVELATIDEATKRSCFSIVRSSTESLENDGKLADATLKRWWLEEWGSEHPGS